MVSVGRVQASSRSLTAPGNVHLGWRTRKAGESTAEMGSYVRGLSAELRVWVGMGHQLAAASMGIKVPTSVS